MGFRLGMPSDEVLGKLGKNVDLNTVRVISGKKILNDTISFPSCGQQFRRSVGFDADHRLSAIGLTHRTDSIQCEAIKTCVLEYLEEKFGSPAIDTADTVVVYTWKFDKAIITLDAKDYNERDWFVQVYYFERRKYDLSN